MTQTPDLPQLAVGQIWQCRRQNNQLKITSVGEVSLATFYHIRGGTDGSYPIDGQRDGGWKFAHLGGDTYSEYDLTVLLYDPT